MNDDKKSNDAANSEGQKQPANTLADAIGETKSLEFVDGLRDHGVFPGPVDAVKPVYPPLPISPGLKARSIGAALGPDKARDFCDMFTHHGIFPGYGGRHGGDEN